MVFRITFLVAFVVAAVIASTTARRATRRHGGSMNQLTTELRGLIVVRAVGVFGVDSAANPGYRSGGVLDGGFR